MSNQCHFYEMLGSLKIGSVNCRGLFSDTIKRRDIFSRYKDKYDIIFLIDTHCTKEVEHCWKNEWGYVAWFSSHSSNSQGVAILFKNSFEYEVLNQIHDPEGNFLILDVKIQGHNITLVAIYGPNQDNPDFFNKLKNKLILFDKSSVIMGGDFNVPQNYETDTLNYVKNNNPKSQQKIHECMSELDLIDVWREINPEVKRYTWRGPFKKLSRLDYFLISSDLQPYILSADIDFAYRSDHSPVNITLNFIENKRGRGTWKFNNSLLNSKEYIQIVKQCINETVHQYFTGVGENGNPTYSIDDQLLWETIKLMIRGKTISYSSHIKKQHDKKEKNLEDKLKELYRNESLQNTEDIEKTEMELRALREEKVRGLIMRAKAKW